MSKDLKSQWATFLLVLLALIAGMVIGALIERTRVPTMIDLKQLREEWRTNATSGDVPNKVGP